jgi:restriction system protein
MARKRDDIWKDFYEALSWVFTLVHPAWSIPVAAVLFFLPVLWFKFYIKIPEAQMLGYVVGAVPATVAMLAGFAGWEARGRCAVFLRQNLDTEWMNRLSWQEFERQVAEIYREQGYTVEETGGGGADGGVDLRLRKEGKTAIVQCKQWRTYKVGVKPVRELFGIMAAERADRAVFITSGTYTDEAIRFAEGKALDLIDGAELWVMLRQFQGSLRQSLQPESVAGRPPSPNQTERGIPPRPRCPKCGNGMVLRSAKTGVHAGQKFWGCLMFAKTNCRGTRPL